MRFYEVKPFVRSVEIKQHAADEIGCVRAGDCRLIYVRSGEGSVRMENREALACRRGTVLLLRPDSPFGFSAREGAISTLEIGFDYTGGYAAQEMPLPPRADRGAPLEDAHEAPLFEDMPLLNEGLYVEDAGEVECVLMEMMSAYMRKKPHWRIKIGAMLTGLISHLCEERDDLVENVIRLVETRYMEPLSNGDIASDLGYHPNYANAVFRNKMGLTIHQYLLRYRIDTAMQLITSTDLPISRIAEKTGFRYFSHFSQCFRRVTGYSPGDYRVHRSNS